MEDNKKKRYEAPTLTVVTFKAERGYANSGEWSRTLSLYEETGTGDQNLEDRGTATEWSW